MASAIAEPSGPLPSRNARMKSASVQPLRPLASGVRFATIGMAGDPNMPIVAKLTPDASGLKGWTEADFIRALREGKGPDGSAIAEAMPWKTYGKMNDTELKAI